MDVKHPAIVIGNKTQAVRREGIVGRDVPVAIMGRILGAPHRTYYGKIAALRSNPAYVRYAARSGTKADLSRGPPWVKGGGRGRFARCRLTP